MKQTLRHMIIDIFFNKLCSCLTSCGPLHTPAVLHNGHFPAKARHLRRLDAGGFPQETPRGGRLRLTKKSRPHNDDTCPADECASWVFARCIHILGVELKEDSRSRSHVMQRNQMTLTADY